MALASLRDEEVGVSHDHKATGVTESSLSDMSHEPQPPRRSSSAVEKLEEINVTDRKEIGARFSFPEPRRANRVVVAAEKLAAGYDGEAVLRPFDVTIVRAFSVVAAVACTENAPPESAGLFGTGRHRPPLPPDVVTAKAPRSAFV